MESGMARGLWFDQIIAAARLPLWVGILIVGILPEWVLWSMGTWLQIAQDAPWVPIVSIPVLALILAFLIVGTQLMLQRMTRLEEYTKTLGIEPRETTLRWLTDLRAIAFIWLAFLAVTSLILDPYLFGLHYSPYQSALRFLVTGYMRFVQATFMWVFAYSMFTIYRWGKLPLRLKSFSEDQTLGLGEFGRASLFLVALYVVAVFLNFPATVTLNLGDAVGESIFFILGVAIFVAPLLSLRKKLLAAKNEKLAWIQGRHRRVIEKIESCGDDSVDATLVIELVAVDSIKNEIRRINSWPFNLEIIAKLLTLVLLPMSVVILTTYLIHVLNL